MVNPNRPFQPIPNPSYPTDAYYLPTIPRVSTHVRLFGSIFHVPTPPTVHPLPTHTNTGADVEQRVGFEVYRSVSRITTMSTTCPPFEAFLPRDVNNSWTLIYLSSARPSTEDAVLFIALLLPNDQSSPWPGFTAEVSFVCRRIADNQFICNCNLAWLAKWLRQRNNMGLFSRCVAPPIHRNTEIAELQEADFTCDGDWRLI